MKKIFPILSILWLFHCIPVLAQIDLVVSVVDNTTRKPLANLPVTLANPSIGFQLQQVTDQQGKTRFKGLSTSGKYEVTAAESDQFYPLKATDILLRSNSSPSVTLVVIPKSTQTLSEVVVQGNSRGTSTSRINTLNAEVAAELSARELQDIPVEARDITRALYRLPNVTQATGFFSEAPNVSINGANSLYTNYLIDGLDNNENFLGGQKFAIPSGFTQNINVLTNNFSTEFGNTANGIVNITTKSGSNQFTGEAFYLTRPGPAIDGKSAFPQRDLSGNQVKSGFQRQQFGFAIGGAIRKDRTFYYVDAEQTFDFKDNFLNAPALGVNATVRGQNRFTYLSGKIDQVWSARFKSSLRANVGLVNIQQQGGGLDGGTTFPSAGNSQDRNSILVASRNVYVGDNFSSETNVQYARFRWNYAKANNLNSSDVTVLDPSGQGIAYLGHPGYLFDALENTWQGQQKFTFYHDRHTFKAGFGLVSSAHSLFGGGNPNGSYVVQLNDAQLATLKSQNLGSSLNVNDIPADAQVQYYGVELRPQSFGKTQNLYNIYLEDLIAVSDRLNLTLGLRYDYDNLSKGGASKGDANNLAPRANINYRLTDRSSLRGGYGIFYDKVLYSVYSDALQQNVTSADYKKEIQALVKQGALPADTDLNRVTFNGNLTGSLSNVPYLQGPGSQALQSQSATLFSNERRILNPNGYQNPYTHQFTLGYQYQVNAQSLFYVDLMYNCSYDLLRLRNVNAPAAYPLNDPNNVTVRTTTQADATRPVPILLDANGNPYAIIDGQTVTGIARNVVVTESAGRSRYVAASFNYKKERGDDKYAYRLSYTLSNLKNNTEDINFRANDANNYAAEWGNSINDRTHVINAIGTYYPVKNLTLTLAALIQSGQPINRVPDARIYGTTDLNGDGSSFGDSYVGNSDRQPGEGRNSDRLPWSKTFDVGIQLNLPLAGNATSRLEIRADVFNVLNTQNLSGYSNNATQSNQIQIGPIGSGIVRKNAGPPRQFQFGLRYAF